jgi:type II secretory ATPase GspE/PulE/Tfp pilus assembly ATPase PilB-like protein
MSATSATEEPNFVIVDQNVQPGEDEITSLIPGLGGANAQRLAELALRLPEQDARDNESIIIEQTESGVYVIGMLDKSNFPYQKNVALILKVDTSRIETHEITESVFNTLMAIAYTGELASLVRQGKEEADQARTTSRDSVAWKVVNPQSSSRVEAATDKSLDSEQARGFRANIEEVLKEGSRRGSSDLHFIPGPVFGTVFNRIDGVLYEFATEIPRDDYERLTRGLCDMAGTNDYELAYSDKDASIKMILPVPGKGDVKTRLRFAAAPGLDGIDISVRYITQEFRDFHEMGHEAESLEIIYRSLKQRNGLVLVTGATGSGKSTLLEAMTRRLQSGDLTHLYVIADPIEYEDSRRTQIEVTDKYTYAQALKSCLRKDPDRIVVGEIRDEEVAEIAIRAAYTGHLVLTTLHTNDIASTFARLDNLKVKSYDQGGLIRAICSQQLVRRLCNHCKEEDPRGSIIASNIIEKIFPNREDLKQSLAGVQDTPLFFQAVGCDLCYQTGYKGRIAVEEVLEVTPDLANMISLGMKGEQAVEFAVNEYGMLTFAESAARKLIRGTTSYAEVEHWLMPPTQKKYRYGRTQTAPPPQTAWSPQAEPRIDHEGAIEAEYVETVAS